MIINYTFPARARRSKWIPFWLSTAVIQVLFSAIFHWSQLAAPACYYSWLDGSIIRYSEVWWSQSRSRGCLEPQLVVVAAVCVFFLST